MISNEERDLDEKISLSERNHRIFQFFVDFFKWFWGNYFNNRLHEIFRKHSEYGFLKQFSLPANQKLNQEIR